MVEPHFIDAVLACSVVCPRCGFLMRNQTYTGGTAAICETEGCELYGVSYEMPTQRLMLLRSKDDEPMPDHLPPKRALEGTVRLRHVGHAVPKLVFDLEYDDAD